MADTASTQLERLTSLIAWLSQRDNDEPISYRAAASHLGVTEETLRGDLDVLVGIGDEYKPWLASLTVGLLADGFTVSSRGPFRRPLRLTAEEVLALTAQMAGSQGGKRLAAKLLATLPKASRPELAEESFLVGPAPSGHVEMVLAVATLGRSARHSIEINYCGSDGEPSHRVIHPYQILEQDGSWYCYAWCETVRGFRLFKCERVLEATLTGRAFEHQQSFRPLTRADSEIHASIVAKVAFEPRIARWIREEHPGGHEDSRGRYVVSFRVADPAWFVREVLQYGDGAEVLEPESLREAVRGAVA
ncbi:MAG TPA: WYL domain-containing protein [Gemmatimonadales bacterium]|nr:WYL domain-containing protein [Gemmatimonadales bacterium]